MTDKINKDEGNTIVEKELGLITENGNKIRIKYGIDENQDDYIREEVREAWENQSTLCLVGYRDCEVSIREEIIDEVDMRKIIGLRWD